LRLLSLIAPSLMDLLKSIMVLGSMVNSTPTPLHFSQAPWGLLKEKWLAERFLAEPKREKSRRR